jgi:hypothetical protein
MGVSTEAVHARECLAFLALWFVPDAGYTWVRSILWKRAETTSSPTP